MAQRKTDKSEPKTDKSEPFYIRTNTGLGGFLEGLGNLVEKLAEIAEKAEGISKTGVIQDEEKKVKGVYGFSVKVGLGDQGLKVEPFGAVRREKQADQSTVAEIREPLVDIFEEDDHVLIVAEMPGIAVEDLHFELKEDILTLSAGKRDKKYHKEILLPGLFSKEKVTVSCNNGVVEIKCAK
jgi:HSP20 family protein